MDAFGRPDHCFAESLFQLVHDGLDSVQHLSFKEFAGLVLLLDAAERQDQDGVTRALWRLAAGPAASVRSTDHQVSPVVFVGGVDATYAAAKNTKSYADFQRGWSVPAGRIDQFLQAAQGQKKKR